MACMLVMARMLVRTSLHPFAMHYMLGAVRDRVVRPVAFERTGVPSHFMRLTGRAMVLVSVLASRPTLLGHGVSTR
jgi:hypothetical protein